MAMNWNSLRIKTQMRRYGSEQIAPRQKNQSRVQRQGYCPKCGSAMERRKHPKDWIPDPKKAYHFAFWDYCRRCHHIQHYDEAKRLHHQQLGQPEKIAAPEAHDYTGPTPWE